MLLRESVLSVSVLAFYRNLAAAGSLRLPCVRVCSEYRPMIQNSSR